MTSILLTVAIFTLLYALYVGGKLRQAEDNLKAVAVALDRHLSTGEDYADHTETRQRLHDKAIRWRLSRTTRLNRGDA